MPSTVLYRGSSALSPHRQASHGALTASQMKTKEHAKDVQDAVEEDFTLHYRVCNTEEFLKRLLPVPKATLDKILQHMKNANVYDSRTHRWTGFPITTHQKGESKEKKTKPKENSLYGAFCAIAEGIRELVSTNPSEMGRASWVDYHSKSPRSKDSKGAHLRPDVLLAFEVIATSKEFQQGKQEEGRGAGGQEEAEEVEVQEEEAEGEAEEVEVQEEEAGGEAEEVEVQEEGEAEVVEVQEEGAEGEADEEGDGDENDENEEEEKEEVEGGQEMKVEDEAKEQNGEGKGNDTTQQLIWWLQIIAAVEMKRSESENWKAVVKQLFGYLRRILREQLDRRFVFGLTLGPDMMTVWLHDRSGVIGTKTAINIHKEPLKFIQVIAALSILPPEKLGFDPTIEILVSPTQAVPSYKPNEEFIRAYEAAPHNRQWVITMNNGWKYVTVETVSSVRAGFMRGRGSIAWVVIPFKRTKESSEILVLKQSWRPRDVDSEGELYDKSECDYVGKIELCEEVLISGSKDATDTLIRQSLDDSTGLGKRARDQMPESTERDIHVKCTNIGDIKEVIARETGPPVSRVRTRVILSTYGWLIKYFSTRRELLVVLRDAIRGHKYLYERGVLHRDISPGNILIKWRPGSEADRPSTSGCLIDLDHGKKGKLAQDKVKTPVSDAMIDLVRKRINVSTDVEVEKEVARLLLEFFPVDRNTGPMITYFENVLEHASKFRSITTQQLCTPQDLQWKTVNILHAFDHTERQKGSRTGTPPYTSGEILSGQWYFPRRKLDNVFHDAVHDLESFFWVLMHICITRQGPGGVRREELEQKNQAKMEYNGLRRVVHCFFDSDMNTMAANKREIFTRPDDFDQSVLDNFHVFFQPLRDLAKEWFHLLIIAHEFHAFEYHNIHDMVLEILDRALESAPPDNINEVEKKVLDDRKVKIQTLSDANPFGLVQQSPPPHTSPSSQRHVAQPVYRTPSGSPTPEHKKGKWDDLQLAL